MHCIWISGYRSYELNVFNNNDPKIKVIKIAIKNYLQQKLEDRCLDWVIAGPNLGVEQWALEVANDLRNFYSDLHTALIFPYTNFGNNWTPSKQEYLSNLRSNVDFYTELSSQNYQNPKQFIQFQEFMLKHTEGALLIYDLEHKGKTSYDYQAIQFYQTQKNYFLDIIDFYDLQDIASES
ncbi:SLOG family protein [Lactobacillus iners]|jgi:UPF0398 protein LJ_1195|uniref:SLOG family protein n=1 Tax=Lactobacillus iners TaxID=147802 RepID=UPI000C7FD932|nr:SLOG family protein [Lactobacillus iners]MCZ9654571.1 SLOG family protein [Lactobacillus iners]MDK7316996.1 SLOG family protein [Lactobacillus iners]MDK8131040.1 SLOG family protein [Lactobacillus iners]PMC41916.1 hypothetical protein CJ223_00500 [Lactobacillus iners]QIC18363.1 DUF1273 family protein [Lactobacillus iners]